MNIATSPQRLARQASTPLQRIALIGLLSLGLTGVSLAANYYEERESASASDEKPSVQAAAEASDQQLAMERVREWVAVRYDLPGASIEPALAAAEEAGRTQGIDPLLIVAVIATESGFNPRAVSRHGARGLMQLMPKYHQDKLGKPSSAAWFDPRQNVRAGTEVLQQGLARYGSVHKALQYYNGAIHDRNMRYARKVMAVKKQLVAVAGNGNRG